MPPLALDWQQTQLLTAKAAAAPRPSERTILVAKQSPMPERLNSYYRFFENRNGQHVTLTPGGHRIHSLQRTTPGGTTRRQHTRLAGSAPRGDAALLASGIHSACATRI